MSAVWESSLRRYVVFVQLLRFVHSHESFLVADRIPLMQEGASPYFTVVTCSHFRSLSPPMRYRTDHPPSMLLQFPYDRLC